MATKNYEVIITPTAYREINRIYEYIEFELYAKDATRKLYTIDEKNRKIFVSHMYYSGKNYFENNSL